MSGFTNNTQNRVKEVRGSKAFKSLMIVVVSIVAVVVLFSLCTFRVDEREQVVVKQFNEVVKVIIDEETPELEAARLSNPSLDDVTVIEGRKGLFLKIPFIQTVETYTNQLLTYDTVPREVITQDKKKLVLDNYAQWKIENAALFVSTINNERKAHQRLDELVYSKLNEEIGKITAHVMISDKEYVNEMLARITASTNEQMVNYGIAVVDIKIKRTDLPLENYENVFNRMRTERERAAKTYRSEGLEEAQKIESAADKQATILEAQAYEQAQTIRGEGDAEALKIYADAYNQDPEFYAFYRSLQAYQKTLGTGTTIVLDPDADFLKYLFNPYGISEEVFEEPAPDPVVEP
ncbi:MAG: protease modulator HflC [Clostridia bacterium]|nr:protease modulator HflC [Clostridia bacterium]MBN2883158.1 protease modulator HflC [Clostridia bacterium]